ncbi:hypothetical protein GCM10010080_24920 [Thermomonas carbonis]|nr:hypothetical protein GCM10010080_24920 [Thermomonas carbonis]
MNSTALESFEHAIQDAVDLLAHFDSINSQPPRPDAEVLKRASLVMALAALETYVEDRVVEAANAVAGLGSDASRLSKFYKSSLENDLKFFHTPSTDRIRAIFDKYFASTSRKAGSGTTTILSEHEASSINLPESEETLRTAPGALSLGNRPRTQ